LLLSEVNDRGDRNEKCSLSALSVELEDHLNVKFTTSEIEQIKNVEQLLIILEKNKPWI